MVKEETLDFGEVKIIVKQLSFAGQMRIEMLGDKRTIYDIYKECVKNSEDLDKINVEQGLEVMKVINKLNKWEQKEEKKDVEDFQKPLLKTESGI